MKIVLFLLCISFVSCINKKPINFINSSWVEKLSENSNRIINFEKVSDSIYFFQIAIFNKNFSIDTSQQALENYICGTLDVNQKNKLLTSDLNISHNFFLKSTNRNIIVGFDKDYDSNNYFPNNENAFKKIFPVKFVFEKCYDTTISKQLLYLNGKYFFEQDSIATYGKLNNRIQNTNLKLYEYPYSTSFKDLEVDQNSLLRYVLINGYYEKGRNNIFYDNNTFYKVYFFKSGTDISSKENKHNTFGWLKKNEIDSNIKFVNNYPSGADMLPTGYNP